MCFNSKIELEKCFLFEMNKLENKIVIKIIVFK